MVSERVHWDDPRHGASEPHVAFPLTRHHPSIDPEGASVSDPEIEALCRDGRFTRVGGARSSRCPDEIPREISPQLLHDAVWRPYHRWKPELARTT